MCSVRICRQPECRQAFRSDLTVSIVTNTCRPGCDDMRHLWCQIIPRLSRRPHGLSRGSGAAWLVGLWVRTPSGGMGVSLSCKCCMLSGRYVWDCPIARPEESFRAWCVRVVSQPRQWGGQGPLGLSSHRKELLLIANRNITLVATQCSPYTAFQPIATALGAVAWDPTSSKTAPVVLWSVRAYSTPRSGVVARVRASEGHYS